MRVVFMGTPEFAVPSLSALADAYEVVLVLTRPDAVRARGKELEPSPVKARALELGLPVLETSRITPEALEAVREAGPDVIAVAAYGCILPDSILDVAPLGCVNVHASLLPRWRGAAPIQRAVLAGDRRAGISIMRVVHELDAGAWCRQASTEVADKPCEQLIAELAQLGATELVAALADMEAGTATWVDQDESLVTFAPKVSKAEMHLAPADRCRDNALRIQASTDAAPARLVVAGKGVRALSARLTGGVGPASGVVLVRKGHVVLGCADGSIELLRVKPDGKREMDVASWAAGLRGEDLSWCRA
ncbi:MAG: methionyl-tRNA formyltransferase [Atopobiaceae bacterium]|nr:methionyl-tRNA formyltransferase [Atopobiaceae bacterium]